MPHKVSPCNALERLIDNEVDYLHPCSQRPRARPCLQRPGKKREAIGVGLSSLMTDLDDLSLTMTDLPRRKATQQRLEQKMWRTKALPQPSQWTIMSSIMTQSCPLNNP